MANRKKRLLRTLLCALALLLLLSLLPLGIVSLCARGRVLDEASAVLPEADCILVLGAGLLPDGSPGPMLLERIETGVRLYQAGRAPKLLMSGDHGTPGHDEVNAMKDAALAAGVPSADVFMDHAGFCTYDSIYRAKAVFGAERVIIVTQAYHLPRALYIARRMGLEAVGAVCDTRRWPGQVYRDIRELLARDKDFYQCIVLPEPRYLGDAIPLSGSGDATNDRTAA